MRWYNGKTSLDSLNNTILIGNTIKYKYNTNSCASGGSGGGGGSDVVVGGGGGGSDVGCGCAIQYISGVCLVLSQVILFN